MTAAMIRDKRLSAKKAKIEAVPLEITNEVITEEEDIGEAEISTEINVDPKPESGVDELNTGQKPPKPPEEV